MVAFENGGGAYIPLVFQLSFPAYSAAPPFQHTRIPSPLFAKLWTVAGSTAARTPAAYGVTAESARRTPCLEASAWRATAGTITRIKGWASAAAPAATPAITSRRVPGRSSAQANAKRHAAVRNRTSADFSGTPA